MDKLPECIVCGKRHRYSEGCSGSPMTGTIVYGAFVPGSSEKATPSKIRCPICGGDEAVLDDAEKWRSLRNKRREYMRKRRAK